MNKQALIVRKLQVADFENYWPLISDASLAQAAGFWAVTDKFSGQMMFNAALQRDLTYLIELDNVIVGSISFEHINEYELEVGYLLLTQYEGRGIMTTALGIAIDKVFTTLHCQRLVAYVPIANLASKKVLQKNKFICENNTDGIGIYMLNKNIKI